MTDVHSRQTRSKNMRAIRSRDTRPEVMIRSQLHRRGYRFRVCPAGIPGKPDLWLPKWNAAIFVHGCFWHVHECDAFHWPATRPDFWKNKLTGNRERDQRVYRTLSLQGIRILVIWECALRGKHRLPEEMAATLAATWLQSGAPGGEIDGEGLHLSSL